MGGFAPPQWDPYNRSREQKPAPMDRLKDAGTRLRRMGAGSATTPGSAGRPKLPSLPRPPGVGQRRATSPTANFRLNNTMSPPTNQDDMGGPATDATGRPTPKPVSRGLSFTNPAMQEAFMKWAQQQKEFLGPALDHPKPSPTLAPQGNTPDFGFRQPGDERETAILRQILMNSLGAGYRAPGGWGG